MVQERPVGTTLKDGKMSDIQMIHCPVFEPFGILMNSFEEDQFLSYAKYTILSASFAVCACYHLIEVVVELAKSETVGVLV